MGCQVRVGDPCALRPPRGDSGRLEVVVPERDERRAAGWRVRRGPRSRLPVPRVGHAQNRYRALRVGGGIALAGTDPRLRPPRRAARARRRSAGKGYGPFTTVEKGYGPVKNAKKGLRTA